MQRVAVIGTQGMLGSTVCRYLTEQNYFVLEINSSGESISKNQVRKFDIALDNIAILEKDLKNIDFVINCAGRIKHKIIDESIISLKEVININSLFPLDLTKLSHKLKFKVVQVATDCVYSGNKGSYSESDAKDPVDLYGYSKVLGEHVDDNLVTLRCSLVGKELKSKIEFLEWVLSHNKENALLGFTNHLWNGLTTLHFAKLVDAIIRMENFTSGLFHVVPKDCVSKFDLAKIIGSSFGRDDLEISESLSTVAVNRTLVTNFSQFNSNLWSAAGYNTVPTISEMVEEYALWL